MNTSFEQEFIDWHGARFSENAAASDKVTWVRKQLWEAWVNCRVWRLSATETANTFDGIIDAMRLVGYVPVSKGHPGSPIPPEGGTPAAAALGVRKAA